MMRVAWLCLAAASACAHGSSDNPDALADARIVTSDAPFCDGLPCDSIYVSRAGNDSSAGTKEAPVKTIDVAITLAAGWNPPKAVFVQAGVYPEPVTMQGGVSVYGGFDETWTRNPAVVTEINAPSPAVTFAGIQTGTALDGITVRSSDATAPGESSYAILVTDSKLIQLTDVVVEAGIGARGLDGSDGTAGANGGNGGTGKPGCEDSGGLCDSCSRPAGGAGGSSACGRYGGVGGYPGNGGGSGQRGGDAFGFPGSGGAGGAGGGGGNGQPGANGPSGAPGMSGGAVERSARSIAARTSPRTARTASPAVTVPAVAAVAAVVAVTTSVTRTAHPAVAVAAAVAAAAPARAVPEAAARSA